MMRRVNKAILVLAAVGLAFGSLVAAQEPSRPAAEQDRKLFAVLLVPGPAWKPGRPFREQGLRAHFDYLTSEFRAGRIVAAGPVGTDSGLVLLFAADLAQAEAFMQADPAVSAGIFEGSVRPYVLRMIDPDALAGATD